eukprot:TRINITY_DN363_c0_g3_i1.p1 TRINITY_DN363_c0_g3~~TRINITY_DN363_c0_g3_i1.p1  ORF type:complete len:153 (+),score=14.02 TRINITY_DN363_c0_g3_i1:44-460(+)
MRFAPGFLKFSTSLGFRRVCASRETISLFPTRFYSMAQPEATKSIAEDRIQLFSLGTPNGFKASVALEELGLPYDLHRINIGKGDQFTDSFKAVNPNSKIPAITDPNGPGSLCRIPPPPVFVSLFGVFLSRIRRCDRH